MSRESVERRDAGVDKSDPSALGVRWDDDGTDDVDDSLPRAIVPLECQLQHAAVDTHSKVSSSISVRQRAVSKQSSAPRCFIRNSVYGCWRGWPRS